MKVRLSEIPEEGLTLNEAFNPEQMNLQTPDLKFTAPVKVKSDFHKDRDVVLRHVKTVGDLDLVCGRCLKHYGQPHEGLFDLDYSVKGKIFLDVTDDIRQEILLSYPMTFVCMETCQGLCVRCGQNLNEGKCDCQKVKNAST